MTTSATANEVSRARWRKRATALGRTLATVTVTLAGLLALTFFIGRVMPVDPVTAIVGEQADQQTYEKVYQELGLDQPLYVQFGRYIADLAEGDFGTAIATGHPVIDDIARVMRDASICGLGTTASVAVQSAIAKFGVFQHDR